MPQVTLISADGHEMRLDVAIGQSVMEAAVMANVSGIMGECGGALNCATCHVYVQGTAGLPLPACGPVEAEMLEATACERRPGSRLSCQLIMTPDLDGLVLALPEAQY